MTSYYVTGTDTGAGKTRASVALLHALRRDGATAVGMKPVASGCTLTPGGWRNDDALALLAASEPVPDYARVNPFALPEPTAPQIAAALAGVRVTLDPIVAAYRQLVAQAEHCVVEGVGGWLAPLADDLDQLALVRALDLPVILVVGMKLGCLNHARLTARAIAEDGCTLAGCIASFIEPPATHDLAYLALVRRALPGPWLGELPWQPDASAAGLAAGLSPP
jgi:dethiobiotin synthetase